jgi:hypothetical protein
MTPILYLALIVVLFIGGAIVHFGGWLWLIVAVVAWVGFLVWRNRKSNRSDPS